MYARKDKQYAKNQPSFTDSYQYDPVQQQRLRMKTAMNDPRVYEVAQVNRYSKINRPYMGEQKRKMIEQKLELDKVAQVQSNARIKVNSLFVKYQNNPFLALPHAENGAKFPQRYRADKDITGIGKMSKQVQQRLQKTQDPQNKNMVQAVNKIPQKKFMKDSDTKAQNRWQEIGQISKNFNKQAQNMSANFIPPIKPKQYIAQQKKEMTFDDILTMEDENYYVKNQADINIFQFMKNNHKPFLSYAILDQFYFCHSSIIDKITTFKLPIVRDLSNIGRKFAKDNFFRQPHRLDYINSNQVNFKVGETKFQDIMSIASGRFNPQIVYKTSNEIIVRQENTIKSQISQKQINYSQNANNFRANFEHSQIQAQEIVDYKRLQNSKEEQRYKYKCDNIYNYIQTEMEKKSRLTGNTIKDKILHQEIDDDVNKKIQFFANMDYNRQEPQKRIRQGKVSKNRNQSAKIHSLLKSIVIKNRQEQKIKILLQGSKK